MRDDRVVQIVEKYIDAVRRNDPSNLPVHPEVVGEFPLNTYRGAESFIAALEPFSRRRRLWRASRRRGYLALQAAQLLHSPP